MVQLGEYIQIISAIIYATSLGLTIFQISAMRKSMLIQNMQQTYATTTQNLYNNFHNKEYLEMTMERLLFHNTIHWLIALNNIT
jgi:hypothetical protein